MLAVLQWIYGPDAASDPYYQLLHDFVVLMPWWYPYMWLGIASSVVAWRLLRRWRLRRQNRSGLRRVRTRVRHLADGPDGSPWVPEAANDDLPIAAAWRHAGD
ncbi:MAG: hypothetical protein ACFB13_01625 [Kiloniellaceae bacterium]